MEIVIGVLLLVALVSGTTIALEDASSDTKLRVCALCIETETAHELHMKKEAPE